MLHQALSSGALGAAHRAAGPVGVTLICLAAVVVAALLILLLNEHRARRRQPRPARQERKAAQQLPEGRIVYQGVDGTGEPLLATSYPLSGKPDYVILSPEGMPIPVELKLTIESEEAQRHHVMQLAAYFVILEDLYDRPPTYGVLRYANKDFTIQYSEALKRKVARRLAEMEHCDEQHPPTLTHQLPSKCHACPFQPICPIGLRQ
ncbi:MAG TPA: PD-(D/E)XK nuclease family protein [Ktedonobacterales bacterium]